VPAGDDVTAQLKIEHRRSALAPEIDAETLQRACQGDARACRLVVERYQRPVYAVLSRLLEPARRNNLVEDLAQECFLRVFRSLPRFQVAGPASLSTWIVTIASRLAIDELRRRPPIASPLAEAADVPAASSPERQAEQQDLRARVSPASKTWRPSTARHWCCGCFTS
jgi:RNA polymerase sigma-70 factor (ECF subfamily)